MDKEPSIAEEHLQAYVKQAISALESIIRTAKLGYENYEKTGDDIILVSSTLAKDVMWFVPNRCPDLLTYSQQVRDEKSRSYKK